ncbi:PopZ family protein [Microvirga sp. TS319]|uniref:PopZ family protein n=1 Tax=Microvirga sp. TS319 TaxID=3241165 RepID=UPI00351A785E
MDDILASIRRIISEDPEPSASESDPTPLQTVLDIAERHVSSGFYSGTLPEPAGEEWPLAQEGPFRSEPSYARARDSEEAAKPVRSVPSERAAAQAFSQPCERNPGEALMSRAAETSVSEAFAQLAAARAASRSPTIEELMKEMLRPMLRAWLDENLPDLVERLVQAEIKRLTRG